MRSNTMKLFQAGNIIGHGGDLVVRHAAGDGVHRRAVLAGVRFRAAELGQLGYRIVLMLTGNARILDGYAIARRAMTAGTGGDLLASDATAVNLLAQVDSIFVLGGAWLGHLSSQIGGNIFLVGVAEHLGIGRHHGLVALWRREIDQLLV